MRNRPTLPPPQNLERAHMVRRKYTKTYSKAACLRTSNETTFIESHSGKIVGKLPYAIYLSGLRSKQ